MNRGAIAAVLRKELREMLRDRRTLVVMIVVPVLLYPAMLIAMEQLATFGLRSLEAAVARVAVVGLAPDADAFLQDDPQIATVHADSPPMTSLQTGSIDVVIVFPRTGWSDLGTNRIELLYDGARERSAHARRVVKRRLDAWADSAVQERLRDRDLPADYTVPITVAETSVASPRDVGGYTLGRFLPLMLIMMTILGAFYPAIDLAAGEKERGTLEALLTVPVEADNLVVGKFAAAALMGLTAATLNLTSMLLTFQAGVLGFGDVTEIQFQLPLRAVLLIFCVLALLAVLFSSLFLGIAVRSHSFKEAQSALTPIYVLSIIPAVLPMVPGMTFGVGFALLPIAGVSFLFRDLMAGTVAPVPAIIAVAATSLYTALGLVFAARAFGREDVLFGTGGSSVDASSGWRALLRDGTGGVPEAGPALGLVAASGLLFFYGGRPLVAGLGEGGVLLSQLLFLAVPALLLVRAGRYDARASFALRSPVPLGLAGGVLVILGGMPIGWLITWVQSYFLEIPHEFLESLQHLITADSPRRLAWLLLVLAVTPAVCEELVFRGVLLRGLAARLPAAAGIGVSALIFGAFHLSFETAIRFLPTAWLGLLIGYAVWRTGSIYTGMLMHFLNNALIVLLVATPALRALFADQTVPPPWPFLALAPVLLYAGVRLLRASAATTPTPSA